MIRLARESRGKDQTAVAEAIGIKQPTYSKIERGEVRPSAEQVGRLAAALDYPPSFFEQTDRLWGTASPHHRKRKSFRPREIEQLEAQLNVYRIALRRLMSSVEITSPFTIPSLGIDDPGIGSPGDVARQVRRLFRIPSGPIASVTQTLEDAGCIIIAKWFSHDRFDAISIWAPSEQPMILMNATYSGDRRRWTLAHELGHLVMHWEGVTDDPEGEASAFAQEYLMPADEIHPELRGLRFTDLPDLKRRWGVSMRALVYRARDLGELTRDQVRYLMMRLNHAYGAKWEPIEIPKEEPTLAQGILEYYRQELGYSVDELAAAARRTTSDFATSFGLAPQLQVV
jgi:Zn-dependent peptidase ImmA (M78 family)/transcriptional regulator with XRE-family HTH domain